jgi:hypothetical protein
MVHRRISNEESVSNQSLTYRIGRARTEHWGPLDTLWGRHSVVTNGANVTRRETAGGRAGERERIAEGDRSLDLGANMGREKEN